MISPRSQATAGRAVYDILAAITRGVTPDVRSLAISHSADRDIWLRVLQVERCAPQLLARGTAIAALPAHAQDLLREQSATALRETLRLLPQLSAVVAIAAREGVTLVALKGAARLLSGEFDGLRSVHDIDLLVVDGDAARLHSALCDELGYTPGAQDGEAHHLPPLELAGSLSVELHTRPGKSRTALAGCIAEGARAVQLGGHRILIPGLTTLLLHTLEHAVLGNWSERHRLRDMLDLADILKHGVNEEAVRAYLSRSPHRRDLELSLRAARSLVVGAAPAPDAWDVVLRTGRARAAASVVGDTLAESHELRRAAGVLAERSPVSMLRACAAGVRRPVRAMRAALSLLAVRRAAVTALTCVAVLSGCTDVTAPTPPGQPDFPVITPFVFVSSEGGANRIWRWENGSASVLGGSEWGDSEPHGAAGKIVFTSYRDGNAEIYIMNADGTAPLRLTSAAAASDLEPSLSADGSRVAFSSNRNGGVRRVWVMNADGSDPVALSTGVGAGIPEGAPTWSPDGEWIAFTSTRSGTSQVWIVAAAGGTPVKITSEAWGAFDPAWSADGTHILYVEASGTTRLRQVGVESGTQSTFAAKDGGLTAPSCAGELCLAARGAEGGLTAIVAWTADGVSDSVVVSGAAELTRPALLVP